MIQHQKTGFYHTFFKLSFFIILQNVVTISVNLLDNVMLARFSEPAMAGSSIVNQIQFVYQQAITALAEAAVIIGSQYWGAKKEKQNRDIVRCALRVGIVVCIVMFAVVSSSIDRFCHALRKTQRFCLRQRSICQLYESRTYFP